MNRNNIPDEPFRVNYGAATFDWCFPRETKCWEIVECAFCPHYDEAKSIVDEWDREEKEDLKQLDLTHTRAWRRHKDYRKAKRKQAIWKYHDIDVELGRMRKGKAYCDCDMCRFEERNLEKPKYKMKHKRNYILEYEQWLDEEEEIARHQIYDEWEREDGVYPHHDPYQAIIVHDKLEEFKKMMDSAVELFINTEVDDWMEQAFRHAYMRFRGQLTIDF